MIVLKSRGYILYTYIYSIMQLDSIKTRFNQFLNASNLLDGSIIYF